VVQKWVHPIKNGVIAIGLRHDALREIHKLRRLIHHAVRPLVPDGDTVLLQRKISPPSATECKLLAELFLSGFGDQIAFKTGNDQNEYKISNEQTAQIHTNSVLVKRGPDIVMFQEMYPKYTEKYTDAVFLEGSGFCAKFGPLNYFFK